jgi:hypothetical protein
VITDIAVALTVAACRANYSICFTSLDDMVRAISEPPKPPAV